ncbi:BamA/TamA family outer membrane protein [Fulvivirgaceae bacterium PWU4]|uniref:BamA/TamA family outer membrane protein n=1 Tax=Chryseosolibacter histidini TaxID=2782349 RepID=A0AAP2DQT9_9BACT|nr:BamA/TamA family outer membrane protein [Chryseosolibacter histidini]MBT1699542.1 BamA/TamA family outer membrane protein [Chryseosolibacter histidini]
MNVIISSARNLRRLFIHGLALLLTSCAATRYIPPGAYFYDETEIVINGKGLTKKQGRALKEKLEASLLLKSNQRILGSRPAVWFYYIAGNPKEHATVRQYIKKTLGSPPVFLSDMQPQFSTKVMTAKLGNNGYFGSSVTYKISTNPKNKSGKITYAVTLPEPYHLGTIRYCLQDDGRFAAVSEKLQEHALLKTGQQYDLERLKAELLRIEKVFRNEGFFFFNRNLLMFEADTTEGNHTINLDLRFREAPPARPGTTYTLDAAKFYFGSNLLLDSASAHRDTLTLHDFDFIYDRKNSANLINPGVIADINDLKKSKVYSIQAEEATRRHILDLSMFQSLRIQFIPAPDSAVLTPHVFLSTRNKKSLTSKLRFVSKSNGTIGPDASITFTNRNIFSGAEKFDLSVSGAYETQITNNESNTLNAFEVKLESSLSLKRLLMPLKTDHHHGTYLPTTVIKAGLDFQNRIDYYNIGAFNTSYGYIWRTSRSRFHEFSPVMVSYVNTSNVSSEFYDLLVLNPSLAISLQDQFILGSRYAYTISRANDKPNDSFEADEWRSNRFYFKGGIEQAGNLLELLLRKANENEERPYQILGSPYSQYIKGDVDVRYYWRLHARHWVVFNAIAGVGYAYGNSQTMPYVKQYSIGGASSLRAFAARTVGPGSYNSSTDPAYADDSVAFQDQYAGMKLQGNIEYRVHIHKVFHGALFLDAGNIWTLREDSVRTGAQFSNQFYKQLAIGAGIGVRLDFKIFLLRFDTALPLHRPDSGWVIQNMDFSSSAWRKENIIFNIGVGYPF